MPASFDRAADFYDETRGYPPGVAERIGQALLDAAGATPASRILELGVGTGRIAMPIVRAGYRYTGVDLSQQMMDRLREKLLQVPGADERVTLVQGDLAALPFPDRSFDVTITVHVLHLVPDRTAALAEQARVLARPGVALNGRDEDSDNDDAVDVAWREIVRDLSGAPPGRSHSGEDASVAETWRGLGATVDVLAPVEWETMHAPLVTVEQLERRVWSRTWSVPDAIYPEVSRRLRAWATSHYGTALDKPMPRRHRFTIERARLG